MTNVIDRRLNPKDKNLVNRQRFLRRAKDAIKQSVKDSLQKRSIENVSGGEKVNIPVKDIVEEHFRRSSKGGRRDHIVPGNDGYIPGDHIPKPQGESGGRGNQGSNDPTVGDDEFQFALTREEFLDFFFEDLDLPDMVKSQLKEAKKFARRRAGYTPTGSVSNLSIEQTMRKSWCRRLALKRPKSADIKDLEKTIAELELKNDPNDIEKIKELKEHLTKLQRKQKFVPYLDPLDLRYRAYTKEPQPTSQAVMFCLMDVSGSMGEREKDISKRFFMLLYLFLTTKYEKIDVVFIRHHTEAKECTEEEFFYSRENGGTIVSSGLEMIHDIIQERYPVEDWNIYVSQCSDGDNYDSDSSRCQEILEKDLLSKVQYYCYIEITRSYGSLTHMMLSKSKTSLWAVYEGIANKWPRFQIRAVESAADIWPVFRELFERKDK